MWNVIYLSTYLFLIGNYGKIRCLNTCTYKGQFCVFNESFFHLDLFTKLKQSIQVIFQTLIWIS